MEPMAMDPKPTMKQMNAKTGSAAAGSFQNNLHRAAVHYANPINTNKQAMICLIMNHAQKWQGEMNKELRNSAATIKWELVMMANNGLEHHVLLMVYQAPLGKRAASRPPGPRATLPP